MSNVAPSGYHGCYLRVDVSRGTGDRGPFAENVLRQFIGGAGLGAWLLLELEASVLVVYQARTEVEGWIPNRLVNAFTRGGLEDMRERLSRAAGEAPDHYDADHSPIRGAGGRPLVHGLGTAP